MQNSFSLSLPVESERLDAAAIALVGRLRYETDLAPVSSAIPALLFEPTFIEFVLGPEHSAEERSHFWNRVRRVMDHSGFEAARFFYVVGQVEGSPRVGFIPEDHSEFVSLCQQLYTDSSWDAVSLTTLVEISTDWFRNFAAMSHEEGPSSPCVQLFSAAPSWTRWMLEQCQPLIRLQEVCLPLDEIIFEEELKIGQVTLAMATVQTVEPWIRSWNERSWLTPGQQQQKERLLHFLDVRSRTNSLAVAYHKSWAEPVRALERAEEATLQALDVLRFYSSASLYPLATNNYCLAGTAFTPRPKHLFLREHSLYSTGTTRRGFHTEQAENRIVKERLDIYRQARFDTLCEIVALHDHKRSPLQRSILKSIELFAHSTRLRPTSDKLVYVVIALESVFVRGQEGNLKRNVAERLAYILGESIEERREIIALYSKAYEMRSATVHRGEMPQDLQTVGRFLRLSWQAFYWLLGQANQFSSPAELLEMIDDIKFD